MENARGLRTAAPSSADRGMAETGAPIFLTEESRQPHGSGTLWSPAPHFPTPPCLKHPTSRHPHIPDIPRPGHRSPGTPCPQPRLGRRPREPAGGVQRVTFRSEPAGGPAGPARPPARRANCPREPPRAPWSAGAAARARAPPPHLPRRCPSCLGGGGDAAARRPRPGRALGPEGKGGEGGGEEEEDAGQAGACAPVREEGRRGRGGEGQRLTESERRGGGGARGRETGLGGARGGKGGALERSASHPARAPLARTGRGLGEGAKNSPAAEASQHGD